MKNIQYFDIHSHLNLDPLFQNRYQVIEKMKENNIGTITVGTGLETSKQAISIAEENPGTCFATVGIHPTDSDELFDLEVFEKLAQHKSVVAIGETGLDYFRDQSEILKQQQTVLFKQHIDLAQKVQKPLMLHVRASKGSDDAYYDALRILQEVSIAEENFARSPDELFFAASSQEKKSPVSEKKFSANFHFFSGSKKCMEDIVAAGYMISVDGPITFTLEYDEMIRACPLDKIMIETDAPFAAPAPYRGKTCEPWMVIEIARKIAAIKGLESEVVRVQLLENTKRFFNLDF